MTGRLAGAEGQEARGMNDEAPFRHCTGLAGAHKFGDMHLVNETNARLDLEATCEVCGYVGQWYTANFARQMATGAPADTLAPDGACQ